jgi:hypothetical protein
MSIHGAAHRSLLIALGGVVLLASGAAEANGVHFVPDPGFSAGFDPLHPVFTDPLDYDIPSGSSFFLISEDPDDDVDFGLSYTLDQCVSLTSGGTCIGPGGIEIDTTPYYNAITLTLDSEIPAAAQNGILLFVGSLAPLSPYGIDEIHFNVDPGTDFQTISYFGYRYLGFQFNAQGESFQFEYFADRMDATKTPVLETLYVGEFVPEPGTGVLVGLGLVGLAIRRRRR